MSFGHLRFLPYQLILSQRVCQFYEEDNRMLLDITWQNKYTDFIASYARKLSVPQIKIDFLLSATLNVVASYLNARNATDVSILFENDENIEKAFSFWANRFNFRTIMVNGLNPRVSNLTREVNQTFMIPSFAVWVASSKNMTILVKTLKGTMITAVPERIIIAVLDTGDAGSMKAILNQSQISWITLDKPTCKNNRENGTTLDIQICFLEKFLVEFIKILDDLNDDRINLFASMARKCFDPSKFPTKLLFNYMLNSQQHVFKMYKNNIVYPLLNSIIEMGNENGYYDVVGKFNNRHGFSLQPGIEIKPNKYFLRISTGKLLPWVIGKVDPDTGKNYYTGYCIDFIKKLAEVMNFNYELDIGGNNYGDRQPNGSWTGRIKDLVEGKIDMVIAPMTITADREETVDFVSPYFAITGLTIVIRQPLLKGSFFKFLRVLRLEVWIVLFGAMLITALTLYALEYFSPFSSRNIQYPYTCRKFDLKECFWMVASSITPLGGGEFPQPLSGRILVGVYWIFVVLLMATFTANLSAFLTSERKRLQVQEISLSQLLGQTKINFTIVNNSWTHSYFKNMENTERDIFELWKQMSQNKTTNVYRVWDYPIKEIYTKILKAIYFFQPVQNAKEGFRKVLEHTEGNLAFIHDYSQIRYMIARTCYLVEVSQPFAERPFAVAVQQGSALKDTIGKAIQNLHKEGFFKALEKKYWGGVPEYCPETDLSDGYRAESLGGIFVIALSILILAIIYLIAEFFDFKCLFTDTTKQGETNKSKMLVTKADLFERDFGRIESISKTQTSGSKFIGPQVTLASHLRSVRANNVGGNYFTVQPRKPLRPPNQIMFLN